MNVGKGEGLMVNGGWGFLIADSGMCNLCLNFSQNTQFAAEKKHLRTSSQYTGEKNLERGVF